MGQRYIAVQWLSAHGGAAVQCGTVAQCTRWGCSAVHHGQVAGRDADEGAAQQAEHEQGGHGEGGRGEELPEGASVGARVHLVLVLFLTVLGLEVDGGGIPAADAHYPTQSVQGTRFAHVGGSVLRLGQWV